MVDVCEITRFTPGDRTLHSDKKSGDACAFVDFMLDMILRTLKEFVSRSAIQKHMERLRDAQRLRRVGPDKGGRWEVIGNAQGG